MRLYIYPSYHPSFRLSRGLGNHSDRRDRRAFTCHCSADPTAFEHLISSDAQTRLRIVGGLSRVGVDESFGDLLNNLEYASGAPGDAVRRAREGLESVRDNISTHRQVPATFHKVSVPTAELVDGPAAKSDVELHVCGPCAPIQRQFAIEVMPAPGDY